MAASLRSLVDKGGFLPKQASENPLLSVEDGIGVVAIEGPILRKPDLFARIFFGATSSEDIGEAIREAAGRDDIKAVFLDIDSPGGTVAGTPELAAAVKSLNDRKPVSDILIRLRRLTDFSQAARKMIWRKLRLPQVWRHGAASG